MSQQALMDFHAVMKELEASRQVVAAIESLRDAKHPAVKLERMQDVDDALDRYHRTVKEGAA